MSAPVVLVAALAATLASGEPVAAPAETVATLAETNSPPSAMAGGKVRDLARITSDTTYYDRKEGLVAFRGHVHVDDSEYQMHANRAYVFLTGTNTLSSIAATGAIALTNGNRRAYGEKLTYRRDSGLVVLHGADGSPATVVDSAPGGDRTVRGSRIRFWINREQIEVENADLSAPRTGAAHALPGLGQKIVPKK